MAGLNTLEEKLQNIATQIARFDLESLIHPASGGTYNFEAESDFIKFIIGFYADVISIDTKHIPPNITEMMSTHASNIFNILKAIKHFDYKQNDPNQTAPQLINNLRNNWVQAYAFTAPHIAFGKVSSSAIARELQTIRTTINEAQSAWEKASNDFKVYKDETEKQIAGLLDESKKVIIATREASGKAAVSRQAKEFEDEANQCLKASRLWFGATIAAVIVSLIVVYVMFLIVPQQHQLSPSLAVSANHPSNITTIIPVEESMLKHPITVEFLQQSIARVLIVTLLYSAIVWFARNYFASRHNYTVNRHRRNAMQTFRAFVEGTQDVATQDFILRQAAACAFSPQQSGYLKDESLPTPTPSAPIIDLARPPTS